MKKTLLKIAAALVGMWVFLFLGYLAGSKKASDLFLRQYMEGSLTTLRTRIKVAELLKTNQKEKAEELLETFIDVDVSTLGVEAKLKPYAPIRQEILQTLKKAKAYRTKWTAPTHKVNKNLKRGVDAAFAMDNVQPGGDTQPAR